MIRYSLAPSYVRNEIAVDALLQRWPGIALDAPERAWNRQPHIAELHRLRSELQQHRDLHTSDSLRVAATSEQRGDDPWHAFLASHSG